MIHSRFRNDLEEDIAIEDTWELPVTPVVTPTAPQQRHDVLPTPMTPRPKSDEIRPTSPLKSPATKATPLIPPRVQMNHLQGPTSLGDQPGCANQSTGLPPTKHMVTTKCGN